MKKYFLFALLAMFLVGCDSPSPYYPSDDDSDKPAVVKGIGVFSVSDSTKVTFSSGNLQCTQSTNTWSFAENQYDYIGFDNVIGGSVELMSLSRICNKKIPILFEAKPRQNRLCYLRKSVTLALPRVNCRSRI